jgi:flagellar biosynthetic protein FliP
MHKGSTTPKVLERCVRRVLIAAWAGLALAGAAAAQDRANAPATVAAPTPPRVPGTLEGSAGDSTAGPQRLVDGALGREGLSATLQIMLLLTVLSLAPALLIMTTSFVRIVVVLGLLRQALGAQQLPPSQVITSISLFVTLLVMAPVWKQVYDEAIVPYTSGAEGIGLDEAWQRGQVPIRRFMAEQLERTGNHQSVHLFLDYLAPAGQGGDAPAPRYVYFDADESAGEQDVPLQALLPAFMLSELKTAFIIGFQIYLPFIILDMVIASVLVSMGMLMLPPVLISLPFKLLLFVLVDGWHLVVEMLLQSFAAYV